MNYEIIPAIMPEEFNDIESLVGLVRGHVSTVQLDIMDGKYVPEKTWPFLYTHDTDLKFLRSQDSSLPFWEDVDYELDLMIERPEQDLETWFGIGARRVIFHYHSIHDWKKIETIDHVTRNFIEIGVAITIHDSIDDVFSLIDKQAIDFIQIMGIATIGYQGEPFERDSLGIATRLRSRYPNLPIAIDGGVSIENVIDLKQAGVNRFVSGSGVFGHGMVDENIKKFEIQLKGNDNEL